MKAFRNKHTSRLGETQFSEDAEVLIRNAKSAGFTDEEIEIIDTTMEEYNKIIGMQNKEDWEFVIEAKKLTEEKIRKKLNLIQEEWREFKEVINAHP